MTVELTVGLVILIAAASEPRDKIRGIAERIMVIASSEADQVEKRKRVFGLRMKKRGGGKESEMPSLR